MRSSLSASPRQPSSMARWRRARRARLVGIRDNLKARVEEAEHEGWLREVEGPWVSLAGAEGKLTQRDSPVSQAQQAVHLGMPSFREIAARGT
ncbi:hypothetical protein ACWY4P_48355 [Streptomyces sp. LZ34]